MATKTDSYAGEIVSQPSFLFEQVNKDGVLERPTLVVFYDDGVDLQQNGHDVYVSHDCFDEFVAALRKRRAEFLKERDRKKSVKSAKA